MGFQSNINQAIGTIGGAVGIKEIINTSKEGSKKIGEQSEAIARQSQAVESQSESMNKAINIMKAQNKRQKEIITAIKAQQEGVKGWKRVLTESDIYDPSSYIQDDYYYPNKKEENK